MMSSEHPWRDWLYLLIAAAIGFALVWGIVRLLIRWAHKEDDSGKPKS